MRVLVCGDRNWDDYSLIAARCAQLPDDTTVVTSLDDRPALVLAFHDYLDNSTNTLALVAEAKRRHIPVEVITHHEVYEL